MFNPKLMKQVQKMQKDMARVQAELEDDRVEATSGGGAVKVVASGKQEIIEIKIDKSAVDPEEVELLEEMVLAAVKEAMGKANELAQEKLGAVTGGMNLPGM